MDESLNLFQVLFNFRLGFRRSFSNSYYCDNSMVANQSIVGSGDSWRASHDKRYYLSFTVADTGYHCTDFSVQEDWTQGENSFEYTFSDEGPWLIRWVKQNGFYLSIILSYRGRLSNSSAFNHTHFILNTRETKPRWYKVMTVTRPDFLWKSLSKNKQIMRKAFTQVGKKMFSYSTLLFHFQNRAIICVY